MTTNENDPDAEHAAQPAQTIFSFPPAEPATSLGQLKFESLVQSVAPVVTKPAIEIPDRESGNDHHAHVAAGDGGSVTGFSFGTKFEFPSSLPKASEISFAFPPVSDIGSASGIGPLLTPKLPSQFHTPTSFPLASNGSSGDTVIWPTVSGADTTFSFYSPSVNDDFLFDPMKMSCNCEVDSDCFIYQQLRTGFEKDRLAYIKFLLERKADLNVRPCSDSLVTWKSLRIGPETQRHVSCYSLSFVHTTHDCAFADH